MRRFGRIRRWLHVRRRHIVVGLITFLSTLAILNLLGFVGETQPRPAVARYDDELIVAGRQITPEEQDYFRRSAPLEQQRILRERREEALTGKR